MSTALVTGATGAVGRGLVSRLVADGYRVRVLTRKPVPPGLLPESVEAVQGDIGDRRALDLAIDGASVIFHLAARLHINNPRPALLGEYRRVNVEATRILAGLAHKAGAERLIFFSTIAVYGPSVDGQVLDENSPPAPTSIYSRTKLEAEDAVIGLERWDGLPLTVVLRLASVYGMGVKGNYRQLVDAVRRGWFVPVGSGSNRRTLVHERDVAEAALLAAKHPEAAGRVFNVTDGMIHRFDEIVEAISINLGRRPPRLHIPVAPALAAAHVVDTCRRIARRNSKAVPMLKKMLEDTAVSGERIREVLGFDPRVGLLPGWRSVILGEPAARPHLELPDPP